MQSCFPSIDSSLLLTYWVSCLEHLSQSPEGDLVYLLCQASVSSSMTFHPHSDGHCEGETQVRA